MDYHHTLQLESKNELIWGLGYRFTADRMTNSFTVAFDPEHRDDHLWSAFLQDSISLLPDHLSLTLGSKVEHNDYTGWEYHPSARIVFTPQPNAMFWGAVSRTVRVPSRANHDVRINFFAFDLPAGLFPTVFSFFGDREMVSEKLLAFELGHRFKAGQHLYFDLAGFYNIYKDHMTAELQAPYIEETPSPHIVAWARSTNAADADSYGFELSARWQILERWKMALRYSFLRIKVDYDDTFANPDLRRFEGSSPRSQYMVASYVTLPFNLEGDISMWYVDELAAFGVSDYFRMDLRVSWKPLDNLEISLFGTKPPRHTAPGMAVRPASDRGGAAHPGATKHLRENRLAVLTHGRWRPTRDH